MYKDQINKSRPKNRKNTKSRKINAQDVSISSSNAKTGICDTMNELYLAKI